MEILWIYYITNQKNIIFLILTILILTCLMVLNNMN
jgi:hypothetical protein